MRIAQGKTLRKTVPRSALGSWTTVRDRAEPLDLIEERCRTCLASLLPLRYARMSASPFSFFRGAAIVMAADQASMPRTGINAQICGDAHIANFGGYASADRRLVFDVNDFDETGSGPWEWDVRRLVASIEICGRDRGFSTEDRARAVARGAQAYREAIASFAHKGNMEVWYARLDVASELERLLADASKQEKGAVLARLKKAFAKTSDAAFSRYVKPSGDTVRIVSDPPRIVSLEDFASSANADALRASLRELLDDYRNSLEHDKQCLLNGFSFVDAAQKVVGVGSVGTRTWIAVLRGNDEGDPLVLQIKEARESVVERYGGSGDAGSAGERVVRGQRLMQATSDILLGWTSAPDLAGNVRDYYVRQLWDWKASIELDAISPEELSVLASWCGWTLARAHARSGDRCEIAGYVGSSDAFDRAMGSFARAYADQNEADYESFKQACDKGRFPCATGA